MTPPHIQQNTCRNCKEKPECTCDKTETNFMQKGDTYLCGHCRPQEFEKASPCDCICHSTPTQHKKDIIKATHKVLEDYKETFQALADSDKWLDCVCGNPQDESCIHRVNSPCYVKVSPTQHTCCDGECNHDDCCGKVPENCPNYYKESNRPDLYPIPENAQRTGDTGRISTQPEWMKEFDIFHVTHIEIHCEECEDKLKQFISTTIQKEIEKARQQGREESDWWGEKLESAYNDGYKQGRNDEAVENDTKFGSPAIG